MHCNHQQRIINHQMNESINQSAINQSNSITTPATTQTTTERAATQQQQHSKNIVRRT